jgi:Ca-activated chloride channel family protein
MYWDNPNVLFGLWILPAVAALLVYAFRKRAAAAMRFADPVMVARLMPSFKGARPWIKGGLVLLGLTCLLIAGARPRFGVYFERVSQRGVDLFVLLDVSRSMLAEDVAPNRLERAKSDVKDLLKKLPGDRVGLIAFAGKPVVKVPLTTDQGFFLMALNEINTLSAPRGGSLIGDAIRKGMETFEDRRDRDQVMVLITDGEDHDSFPEEAAKKAAEQGVKIFTVGLGDPDGARIPIRDEQGALRYVKESDGREHWSEMDEDLLKSIALNTQGAYIPAKTTAYDLGRVYEDHLAGLTRGEIQAEKRKRFQERFQLFVCLGVALLLLDMLIPSYPRNHLRPIFKEGES